MFKKGDKVEFVASEVFTLGGTRVTIEVPPGIRGKVVRVTKTFVTVRVKSLKRVLGNNDFELVVERASSLARR